MRRARMSRNSDYRILPRITTTAVITAAVKKSKEIAIGAIWP